MKIFSILTLVASSLCLSAQASDVITIKDQALKLAQHIEEGTRGDRRVRESLLGLLELSHTDWTAFPLLLRVVRNQAKTLGPDSVAPLIRMLERAQSGDQAEEKSSAIGVYEQMQLLVALLQPAYQIHWLEAESLATQILKLPINPLIHPVRPEPLNLHRRAPRALLAALWDDFLQNPDEVGRSSHTLFRAYAQHHSERLSRPALMDNYLKTIRLPAADLLRLLDPIYALVSDNGVLLSFWIDALAMRIRSGREDVLSGHLSLAQLRAENEFLVKATEHLSERYPTHESARPLIQEMLKTDGLFSEFMTQTIQSRLRGADWDALNKLTPELCSRLLRN